MTEGKYCDDIFLFQKTLKKLREVDDKIIYALNQSTPTKSFQVGNCLVASREVCL